MKKLLLALTAFGVVMFGAVSPGTVSAYPPETTTTTILTETVVTLPNTGETEAAVPTSTVSAVLPDTGGTDVTSGAAGRPLPSTGSNGIATSITTGGAILAVGIGLLVVAGIRRRNAITPPSA
jgi:hypothetical protein